MATLKGGIFSRPAGKTGGIVFGAARTRTGKLVTSRLLVPPSNPRTPAQVTQRNKFTSTLSLIRRWGAPIYQTDWNRSVGQLPGFQSLESVILNQMDDALDLIINLPINLGTLHFPQTINYTRNNAGAFEASWSTENGSNGTSNDIAVFILAAVDPTSREAINGVYVNTSITRSTGLVSVPAVLNDAAHYQAYMYFRGAGISSGLLSIATPTPFNLL